MNSRLPVNLDVRQLSVNRQMRLGKASSKLLPVAVAVVTFVIGFESLYFRNPVIMEITTHGYGMVYPRAEILELRVYQNGRLEYDVYPPQEDEILNIHYWFPRRYSKLNSDDVNELIRLAEQPDFLAAQEQYEGSYPHVDDTWKTTIRFNHRGGTKQIVAINFWDSPDDAAKYPPSMITLLKKVSALRVKLTGHN
jgi:hypothetical protein